MKYSKALQVAIDAMKIQRRRHWDNALALVDVCGLWRSEYQKWLEYDDAISLFEELLEDEKKPMRTFTHEETVANSLIWKKNADKQFAVMEGRMSKKRAKQVFDFIIEYKRSNDGNAPSVRDIQDGIDYHSMSGVVSALKFLEKHKLIERKGKERYICVTGGRWSWNYDVTMMLHYEDKPTTTYR